MNDLILQGISIYVGSISLLSLYIAAFNKKSSWPLASSLLKLSVYLALIALNIGLGWTAPALMNALAFTGWSIIAWKRRTTGPNEGTRDYIHWGRGHQVYINGKEWSD